MANPLQIDYRMDEDFQHFFQILRDGLSFDLTGAVLTLYVADRANRKDDEVVTIGGGLIKVITADPLHELIRAKVSVAVVRNDIPDAFAPGTTDDAPIKRFWWVHVLETSGNDFYFPKTAQPFRIFGGGDGT